MFKEALSSLKAFFTKYKRDFIVTYVLLVIIAIVQLICAFTVDAEGAYTIKAGTYRFNDVMTEPSERITQSIDFTFDTYSPLFDSNFHVVCGGFDVTINVFTLQYLITDSEPTLDLELPTYADVYGGSAEFWDTYTYGEGVQTITIAEDTEVSDEFYEWYSANVVRQYDLSELTIQGSYMFKNDLTSYLNSPFRIPFNFTVNSSGNTYQYIAIGSNGSGDMYFETESGNVEVVYDELYGGWPIQEYRSINLNAPKVLTSEQYSIFKNLVVPLERVTPIRGKWVANDVLSPPSQAGIYGSTIDLKFTAYIQYASANVLCYADRITLSYTESTVDMFYRVVNSIPDLRGYGYQLPYQMQVVDGNSFVSALGGGTKYIDFGEQEQYMPTPFYNWFIVNFSPEPIYDKGQSDNIKDEINSVPKPDVGQMEDVFSPEDYFDEQDPTFLANMGMFKDILGNSIMLPIVSLVLIFGVISFVIFGKRG